MARLFDLCSGSVPSEEVKRTFRNAVVFASQCSALEKRQVALSRLEGDGMFSDCMTARPRKKYRNTVSSEQAGKLGAKLHTARWSGSYITNVYRSIN